LRLPVDADLGEFETNLRKERQLEGIAKAKAEGKYRAVQPRSMPLRSVQ
jgi:DNA invertase Pin-like site-specific DNA recombinase